MNFKIVTLSTPDDLTWAATLMAENEPWMTLKRDYDSCLAVLSNATKERYIVRANDERAGFLILDMTGPFPGYIQTIGIAPAARNCGIGTRTLAWAEARIFRDSPNAFICVSSFNPAAERLYERLGFEKVGVLKSFIVDDHDEWLLRKTRGSWDAFRGARPSTDMPARRRKYVGPMETRDSSCRLPNRKWPPRCCEPRGGPSPKP
jgi:ribosomal protein S18 acetylase RimI-like enzyme